MSLGRNSLRKFVERDSLSRVQIVIERLSGRVRDSLMEKIAKGKKKKEK